MAEPISITVAAAAIVIPTILGGLQSSLQFALDAMPEIHDTRNKHAMKKLLAYFYKAKMGELTEKDFQKAKGHYFKLRSVALFAENQTILDDLENVLCLMEGTLVVQNLMNKKTEKSQLSDIVTLNPGLQVLKALKQEDSIIEASEDYGLPSYTTVWKTPAPLETHMPQAAEKDPVKSKTWKKPAMWCAVVLMPPLIFVPKIRQQC